MSGHDDKDIVDHAAEVDDSYQSDAGTVDSSEAQALHAAHQAGHHETYDPKCERCRIEAQKEYQRKLASGELNKIEFTD